MLSKHASENQKLMNAGLENLEYKFRDRLKALAGELLNERVELLQ